MNCAWTKIDGKPCGERAEYFYRDAKKKKRVPVCSLHAALMKAAVGSYGGKVDLEEMGQAPQMELGISEEKNEGENREG